MLLEKEGLVDIRPRRRPRVATIDMEEVREIYLVRNVLFGKIAIDVIEHALDTDLKKLRAALDRMRKSHRSSDLDGYLWANVDFYNCMTDAANNRTAKRILDSLLLRTLRLRRLSLSLPDRLDKSLFHHVQLVDAFEDNDAPLAAALIRSNHLQALATLESYLTEKNLRKPAFRRIRRTTPEDI